MKRTAFTLASVGVLIIGAAVFFGLSGKDRVNLSAQTIDSARAVVEIANKEFVAETAMTVEEHGQGLSGRQSLNEGAGMLFVFEPEQNVSFWMHDMRFSLDMIFIRDSRVIAIERNVPVPNEPIDPDKLPRYSPNQPVSHVLEVNAGEATGIKIGDTVNIRSFNQT